MLEWIPDYGLLALFIVSFLAATLIPFSSEVALVAAIKFSGDPFTALAVASAGNILACMFNYGMGYFFRVKAEKRLLAQGWGRRALDFWDQYGRWSLLLNWMPLIGDPITVAAGIGRFRFWEFMLMVTLLRVGRYLVVMWFFV
jgi:membrane protein YqaA with SNARE-associated domain